jgi:choline dehydrogenase-like flavoprotein
VTVEAGTSGADSGGLDDFGYKESLDRSIGKFASFAAGVSYISILTGSVPFDMNTLRRGYPTTDNGFCLTPNVTQGRSRGTVRLRCRDYRDRAKVDPRYFTDPEGYDERIMLTGVRLARTIAEQPPLAPWVARELAPGPDATTDDELLDYIHQCHNTVYHPAATARMGAVDDPMAVLDPELRVKGVSRLRVVDASAMPKLPAVNPNITVMTMAEESADLVRKSAAAQRNS